MNYRIHFMNYRIRVRERERVVTRIETDFETIQC